MAITFRFRNLLLRAAVRLLKTRHGVNGLGRADDLATATCNLRGFWNRAFLLRFDLTLPPDELARLACTLPIWISVKSIVIRIARLVSGWWRFASMHDLALAIGNPFGSSIGAVV